MDATAWVAVAGIVGTVLAPLVLERMRRESARREHLLAHRTGAYADLLRVTAKLVDNAAQWAFTPTADLTQTDDEELNAIVARVRVVGSPRLFDKLKEFESETHKFNRLFSLVDAALPRERMAEVLARIVEGQTTAPGDEWWQEQQKAMATAADAMRNRHVELLNLVRAEVGGEKGPIRRLFWRT